MAKGRAANHKSALARPKRSRATLSVPCVDKALNMANKRGEELETVRGALNEAGEGRQKAEVGGAAEGRGGGAAEQGG